MADLPVKPTQLRAVDPYEDIISSNIINIQFSLVQSSRGIVKGLELQIASTRSLIVKPGICVVDKTVVTLPEQSVIYLTQTDFKPSRENVVYIEYKYELIYPVPEAIINILPTEEFTESDNTVILGFMDITSSETIASIYNNSQVTDLTRTSSIIDQMLNDQVFNLPIPIKLDADINMNGHRITNVPDPVHDLDLVSKVWVDTYIESHANDRLVKVDESSASSTHYPDEFSIEKGWFLDECIVCDNDVITKRIVGDPNTSRKIELSKTDYRCKVTSGDSVYLGGK